MVPSGDAFIGMMMASQLGEEDANRLIGSNLDDISRQSMLESNQRNRINAATDRSTAATNGGANVGGGDGKNGFDFSAVNNVPVSVEANLGLNWNPYTNAVGIPNPYYTGSGHSGVHVTNVHKVNAAGPKVSAQSLQPYYTSRPSNIVSNRMQHLKLANGSQHPTNKPYEFSPTISTSAKTRFNYDTTPGQNMSEPNAVNSSRDTVEIPGLGSPPPVGRAPSPEPMVVEIKTLPKPDALLSSKPGGSLSQLSLTLTSNAVTRMTNNQPKKAKEIESKSPSRIEMEAPVWALTPSTIVSQNGHAIQPAVQVKRNYTVPVSSSSEPAKPPIRYKSASSSSRNGSVDFEPYEEMFNNCSTTNMIDPGVSVPETKYELPGTCLGPGCSKATVIDVQWDNEFCSAHCAVAHCLAVFTQWVALNNNASAAK